MTEQTQPSADELQAVQEQRITELANTLVRLANTYDFQTICGATASLSSTVTRTLVASADVPITTISQMAGHFQGLSEGLMQVRERRLAEDAKKGKRTTKKRAVKKKATRKKVVRKKATKRR